ncbi:uncharacterized protein TNCV_1683901 [Trichonephila clavipes]|nr:uncharacterized protein TNCV_1683901 [Trichonephila clavipes]
MPGFCQMTGTLPPLLDCVVGGGTPERSCFHACGSKSAVPGSGDLLIETKSPLQTKSFLLTKTFQKSPVTVRPHKTLNFCRGVISEPDLLSTPESEILEEFSDKGVIQVRRITIKKDSTIVPTRHLILTFKARNCLQQSKLVI